jgi:hypothetical protein
LTSLKALRADARLQRHGKARRSRPEMAMQRMKPWLALATCGLILAPSGPALGWGSTTTVHNLNTHGCLDRFAYEYLQRDTAFGGANFPTLDRIEANEGADAHEVGPGPDATTSHVQYSYHWYNPRTSEGHADLGTAKNFLPLAYGKPGREQGAAWSAHFLADANVPYHLNGEYAADLQNQMRTGGGRVILDERVTGNRSLFGGLTPGGSVVATPQLSHNDDFTREAQRFEAAQAAGDPNGLLDWFDPWFWNGDVPLAPSLSSSHVLYEAKAPECPLVPVSSYSPYWTGNPQTRLGDPTAAVNKAVEDFVRAMARHADADAAFHVRNSDMAEADAATAIATLWRASFSALRVNAVVVFDPATLADPNQTPVADLRGKLGNLTAETATDIQMRVRVVSGGCRLLTARTPEVQSLATLPKSTIDFGDWRVEVPRPGACRLSVEAVGRYARTPDLQLTWRNLYVTAPAATTPPPECNCRPGDTMCLTLCHHNPGQPTNEEPPVRPPCTTLNTHNCIPPNDQE